MTTLKPIIMTGLPIFYNPCVDPIHVEGENFSVDVFVIDENGMHGLAFYNFDTHTWSFHTDTLVDYNEIGRETKWKWYYPPYGIKDAFKDFSTQNQNHARSNNRMGS